MTLFNTLRTALYGITGNKLRAILTTLGIIIGVASVIAMLALGNGARAAVEANFRFLGSDNVQITAKEEFDEDELVPIGEILAYEDGLHMPSEVALVRQAIMSVSQAGRVRYQRISLDMTVQGVTAEALLTNARVGQVQPIDWPDGQPLTAADFMGQGRFFTAAEVLAGAEVCVLGHDTALDLFEGDNPLDEVVWVNRTRCLVIGVTPGRKSIERSCQNRFQNKTAVSGWFNSSREPSPRRRAMGLSANATRARASGGSASSSGKT
jgi:macrolide transport system ATP-binding/permease protein